MSDPAPQSFANHVKIPTSFFLVFGLALLALILAGIGVWQSPSPASFALLTAILAGIGSLEIYRGYALKLQDRIIRTEMHLRLGALAPDLDPEGFTLDQLIALRFAGDGELPALARKVQDEVLLKRKPIKELVRDWRADHLRV